MFFNEKENIFFYINTIHQNTLKNKSNKSNVSSLITVNSTFQQILKIPS